MLIQMKKKSKAKAKQKENEMKVAVYKNLNTDKWSVRFEYSPNESLEVMDPIRIIVDTMT